MKIEMDESTSVATCFCAFFLATASIVMFGCHQTTHEDMEASRLEHERQLEMVKAGLVQKVEQTSGSTSSTTIWTKP